MEWETRCAQIGKRKKKYTRIATADGSSHWKSSLWSAQFHKLHKINGLVRYQNTGIWGYVQIQILMFFPFIAWRRCEEVLFNKIATWPTQPFIRSRLLLWLQPGWILARSSLGSSAGRQTGGLNSNFSASVGPECENNTDPRVPYGGVLEDQLLGGF